MSQCGLRLSDPTVMNMIKIYHGTVPCLSRSNPQSHTLDRSSGQTGLTVVIFTEVLYLKGAVFGLA